MADTERYQITADELKWAFQEFLRIDLRHSVDYAGDARIVSIMGIYTQEDPRVSAGCETGIKLGLLIAMKRQEQPQPHPDTARLDWLETLDAPSISQYGQGMWQMWRHGKHYTSPFLRMLIDHAMGEKEPQE